MLLCREITSLVRCSSFLRYHIGSSRGPAGLIHEPQEVTRSFQEIINSTKFNPESVEYKPSKALVQRLLRKHGLFEFNPDLVLEDILEQHLEDEEEVNAYMDNIVYNISRRCKYCDDKGCRICLGIDL